jgi:Family of unknown function (DUF6188)
MSAWRRDRRSVDLRGDDMQTPATLIGSQVYQVTFDFQTALELLRQDDSAAIRIHADLVIYSQFVLRSRDGTVHHLDPETSRSALGPVIDLLLGTITGVTVDGNDAVERDGNGNPVNSLGTLTIDFADGAQLIVPPARIPDDSWELGYRDADDQHDSRTRFRLRRPRLTAGFKPGPDPRKSRFRTLRGQRRWPPSGVAELART